MSDIVSIVGAGMIARAHARAATKLTRGVELAVTDPNRQAVADFVNEFPSVRVFESLDEMLDRSPGADDIVVVATPPFAHADAAVRSLKSGRHALCEKPLGLNLSEAQTMLQAARAAGRHLGCCSSRFLGLPAQQRVRKLLTDGALGELHHLTFINRARRSRSGIEYQPASQWFLRKSSAGGGVLMDWGPYDIACMVDVIQPEKVEVRHAWMARPLTAIDPPDVSLDTEQHFGASLVMHPRIGTPVNVTYERAACTHGEEYAHVEFQGNRGAVRWDWLGGKGNLTLSTDQAGQVQSTTTAHPDSSGLGAHDKPLVYFHTHVAQRQPSFALLDEHALFNFAIIRAIYETVSSGQPQSVALADFAKLSQSESI